MTLALSLNLGNISCPLMALASAELAAVWVINERRMVKRQEEPAKPKAWPPTHLN